MNRYQFLLTIVLMPASAAVGQQTQVSHFNSSGPFARGYFSSSGPDFISGSVEVSGGCYGGGASSNTHLFYYITVYGSSGYSFSYGEGCIPNTAFVADPSRKRLTLTVEIAALDPVVFWQYTVGTFPSSIVSAIWYQTDSQTYFFSGTSQSTLKLPDGLIFKQQQQGSSQTNSANLSANLLGFAQYQPDGGTMSFSRNVNVQIERTRRP
jgi:hypothetical protein